MIELQYYISNIPDCLIYGLLAMGIYISLRILDIPDLTTEGSFGFGAVISVLVALNGHPILALFAGIVAGAVAGAITGLLQTKLQSCTCGNNNNEWIVLDKSCMLFPYGKRCNNELKL